MFIRSRCRLHADRLPADNLARRFPPYKRTPERSADPSCVFFLEISPTPPIERLKGWGGGVRSDNDRTQGHVSGVCQVSHGPYIGPGR